MFKKHVVYQPAALLIGIIYFLYSDIGGAQCLKLKLIMVHDFSQNTSLQSTAPPDMSDEERMKKEQRRKELLERSCRRLMADTRYTGAFCQHFDEKKHAASKIGPINNLAGAIDCMENRLLQSASSIPPTTEEHDLMWSVDSAGSGMMCLSGKTPFKLGSEPQDCARYVQLKRERFEAKQSSSSGGQELQIIKRQLFLIGEAEKYLRKEPSIYDKRTEELSSIRKSSERQRKFLQRNDQLSSIRKSSWRERSERQRKF